MLKVSVASMSSSAMVIRTDPLCDPTPFWLTWIRTSM